MELHFFPGQHLLVILSDDKYTYRFEAWGGPSSMGDDPYMAEEPTWPGVYIIHSMQTYHTPTWPLSKIKWGVKLRDMPHLNDIYYELPSKKWGSVTKDVGVDRKYIINLYFQYYGKMKVPSLWVFNDFGPLAIRWFKDSNNNKTLDKSEILSGQMFHTTPENEAQSTQEKPIELSYSHGCIHLKPADRDVLASLGAFKAKTTFVVHKYDEKI